MKRYALPVGAVGVLALAGAVWAGVAWFRTAQRPIVVGILHSKTGPMAISESSMIDAEVLALTELNERGGLLGRPIQWEIADGASDWPTFAREARRLIEDKHVRVIFGCWTSASRKSVLPVVTEKQHLLVYPMAYEGLEQSPYVVYTGAAPNQQLIPTVKWAYDRLKARRFFLVGSDYIWPNTVNEIVKDQLKALRAELAGEEYVYFGSRKVAGVVRKIKEAKPDVVLSAVVGDTNVAFYEELYNQGLRPEQTPVVSFSIAEDELRQLPAEHKAHMVGHYAAWNYFQSIPRPENQRFVQAFRKLHGEDRVTSDVMAAAYNSVHLWAQAVREAKSDEVARVRTAIRNQSLNAPEGVISIDPSTQHTWRSVYIGRIRPDGQFDIVWNLPRPVRPVPYPITRSQVEWDKLVQGLYHRWGNNWQNPNDRTSAARDGPGEKKSAVRSRVSERQSRLPTPGP